MLYELLDIWNDLNSTCPISDDRNALSCRVEGSIPVTGVTQMTLILLNARYIGKFPSVETSNCCYYYIKMLLDFRLGRNVENLQLPLSRSSFPFCTEDMRFRAKAVIYAVLSCNALPISSNFVTLGVFFSPFGVRTKCGLVYMCWYIAPYSRIYILKPRSSLNMSVEYNIS